MDGGLAKAAMQPDQPNEYHILELLRAWDPSVSLSPH